MPYNIATDRKLPSFKKNNNQDLRTSGRKILKVNANSWKW